MAPLPCSRRRGRHVLLAALVGAATALMPAAAAPAAIELGFNSEDVLRSTTTDGRGTEDVGMATALANARRAGATVWRFEIYWTRVAPLAPPSGEAAADPAWSGYDWAAVDRGVRAVVAAGLDPLPFVYRAPAWAEGPGRPPVTGRLPAGTWRPNADAFRFFARALATRYSGSYPDPLQPGQALPKITNWQGWNEPNLYVYLTPQYAPDGKGGYVRESPRLFRGLLNAFATGIKEGNPKAKIVAGATAPYGDYQVKIADRHRMPPLEFWRELLCVRSGKGGLVASKRCPKLRFDVYAHNPYTPRAPDQPALNADDIAVPDLGKLTRLVRRALDAGTVRPRARSKALWITEISWDSAPDPDAFSAARQAEYVAGAIAVLARERAERIYFWNLRDDAPVPSWEATYQSGIFWRGETPAQDRPKPSFTAFRFPFTAYRSAGRARVWGRAPVRSRVVRVQRRQGGAWRTVARVHPQGDRVFERTLRVPRGTQLRALQGSDASLTWTSR